MEYNEVKHEKIHSLPPNEDWLVMQRLFRKNEKDSIDSMPIANMPMGAFIKEITDALAKKTDIELSHVLRAIVSDTAAKKAKLKAKK